MLPRPLLARVASKGSYGSESIHLSKDIHVGKRMQTFQQRVKALLCLSRFTKVGADMSHVV
jgi:hypothetical protein